MKLERIIQRPSFAGLVAFLIAFSCSRVWEPSASELSTPETPSRGSRLRVVTFNISGAPDLERLGRLVARDTETRGADVLLLQELPSGTTTKALEDLGSQIGLPFGHCAERHVGAPSLGLLSRFPLQDLEVLPLPQFDLGYRSRRRIAIAATMSFEGDLVRIYNVHLDTRIRLSDRIRQIQPVVEGALAAPRAVIGGDVNTIRSIPFLLPWLPLPLPGFSQAPGLDAHMRTLGFETAVESVPWTGPLRMRLDAVFARGLRPGRNGIVPFPGLSDHAALWIDWIAVGEEAAP